jgi:hypothetical protein
VFVGPSDTVAAKIAAGIRALSLWQRGDGH